MPDLTGLSIREAVALCAARGLKIKPSGEGVVAMQNPPPGALVAQDAVCQVRLSKLIRKETAKETRPEATAKKPVEMKKVQKEPGQRVTAKKLVKKESKPALRAKKSKPSASPSRRVVARKN